MKITWNTIFLVLVITPFVLLLLSMIWAFIFYTIKGYRIKKKQRPRRKSVFKRLLFDFPKQFWLDRFNAVPYEFKEYGLHMFCGEQGSGKTVSVVETLIRLKDKYKNVKIRTNFAYVHQDGEINSWQDLVANENGIYGQIEVLDEIQTWFSSAQSRDFPPQMLKEISQERKQRKMLIGTAQVYGRIAKPIREQTSFVYCPITILGCITIVRVTKPRYYNEDKQTFDRYLKHYFFVHDDAVRNSYDTYKKIEGLTKSGFVYRPDLVSHEN